MPNEEPTEETLTARYGGRAAGRFSAVAGDISGAFADLGTFLPIVTGLIVVRGFEPGSILVGFGLFALAVAAIYRRPIPVQPMKAVAAIAIAGGLDVAAVQASGLIIGVALIALAFSGVIVWLTRAVPQSVLAGIQLAIGLQLALVGLSLVSGNAAIGGLALLALVGLRFTRLDPFSTLVVIAAAVAWSITEGATQTTSLALGFHPPVLRLPDMSAFIQAGQSIVLPQLALTLTNAVLVTAAIAAELFPDDRQRLSTHRLSLSTGILNVLLAPFGAIPMCHGAGGLVVQHRFGARTGLAPAIFGTACLGLGLGLGADAVQLLLLIPPEAVGALLAIAGAELALTKRIWDGRPDCLAVIALTAIVSLFAGVAVGLAAGMVGEILRSRIVQMRARR